MATLAVLVLAASAARGAAAATVEVATSSEFTSAFVNPDVNGEGMYDAAPRSRRLAACA